MRQQDNTTRDDDQLNKGAHHQFFLCLRPAVMENFGTTASGSPFKHLRVQSLDGGARILQPVTPSSSDKDPATAAAHYKKKTSRRKFVRLIKAVLFETSLANKIKKRAKKKKQIANEEIIENNDMYPVMETTLNNKKFGKRNQSKIITGTPSVETSSMLSSSSCASSIASSSMRFPDSDVTNNYNNNVTAEQKLMNSTNEEKSGRLGYFYGNTGLCLILVALVVLVIWGKLFAILCTSAWLFFVPNWRKGKNLLLLKVKSRGKSDQESMDNNKEEYNKKVIMEGLLDRKRS